MEADRECHRTMEALGSSCDKLFMSRSKSIHTMTQVDLPRSDTCFVLPLSAISSFCKAVLLSIVQDLAEGRDLL